MEIIIVALVISIPFGIWVTSLEFRHAYLRQKLINRTSIDDMVQINQTDLDFWSFLK